MSVRRLVRTAASAGAVVALAALASLPALAQSPVTDIGPLIVGDGLPSPLADGPADVRRGRAIVTDPLRGNCTICHVVPGESERFQGDVGPSLSGVGSRYSVAQIRLRVADGRRLNPASIMPAYYRSTDRLIRVARRHDGKPVLTAAEVEDIVAFLMTLKN